MNKLSKFLDFLSKLNESYIDNNLLEKIDYTLLKPEATEDDIIELCEKADLLCVKSVCVLPKMVKVASDVLFDSDVLVCTVVSFPEGTNSTQSKLNETKKAINEGADEIDMVLNYPLLKPKPDQRLNEELDEYEELVYDVQTLVDECHRHNNKNGEPIILKVIVESGLLTEDETEKSTHICLDAGADFIKTSTGMVSIGAELDKIQIMKRIINEEDSDMKIKASGGIKTMSDLQKFSPYVDRFGVGYAAVDSIFGEGEKSVGDGY